MMNDIIVKIVISAQYFHKSSQVLSYPGEPALADVHCYQFFSMIFSN